MLPIYSHNDIQIWDRQTTISQKITVSDLVRRAASQFCLWFSQKYPSPDQEIVILAGKGLNGQDALAIAKILSTSYYYIDIWLDKKASIPKNIEGCKRDYKKLYHHPDIIIDGLFGSGLNRLITGEYVEIIQWAIEQENCQRIAIDIPSGLEIDSPLNGVAFEAHHTFSFASPKLPFFFSEYHQFVGNWVIGDIHMDKEFVSSHPPKLNFIEVSDLKKLLIPLARFDHKGTKGHALVIGGSADKMGAAILMASACMKSGVGLCSSMIPKGLENIQQISNPEVMTITLQKIIDQTKYSAIGIGPGLSMMSEAAEITRHFINNTKVPLVLDADALNIIGSANLLSNIPNNSILTPHPKEFERLFGQTKNSYDQLNIALEKAQEYSIYILLKGAYSLLCTPEGKGYYNCSGNEGMATAGSGDVLTGIITGLLAQGYSPFESGLLGMYLHGLAGDLAVRHINKRSLLASDIIDHLSTAYNFIEKIDA